MRGSPTLTHHTEIASRRTQLSSQLAHHKVEGLLITALPNVRYLSGFTGSNGTILLTDDRAILFTDPRYQTQAPLESDCEVKIAKGPVLSEVLKVLKRLGVKRLGF